MNDFRFAYRQLMKQLYPASVNSAVIDKLRGPGFWAAHRVPFTMLSGVPPRQASPRKLPRLPAGPRASHTPADRRRAGPNSSRPLFRSVKTWCSYKDVSRDYPQEAPQTCRLACRRSAPRCWRAGRNLAPARNHRISRSWKRGVRGGWRLNPSAIV